MCRLIRALYGHPNAGLYWEQYCWDKLIKIGFQPVPGHEPCYMHKQRQVLLGVYVDDFILAGNKDHPDFVAAFVALQPLYTFGDWQQNDFVM